MLKKTSLGLLLALLTYILWGVLSLYWKLLVGIPADVIFSYRIVFTVLTMLVYMVIAHKKDSYSDSFKSVLNDKKLFIKMFLASLAISINWLVYIFAVSHHLATQASLGYYILPIVSVLLALLFLKEHLDKVTVTAICLAAFGVCFLVFRTGQFPFISLVLAFSFGLYGLLKKTVGLTSDFAMLLESLFILPFAIIYLLVFVKVGFWTYSLSQMILLVISGVVTVIPLLLFAEALKRAPLNKVGFIQYINPTIQFLIAIFVFKESFSLLELQGFLFIWLAIGIFILGQIKLVKK